MKNFAQTIATRFVRVRLALSTALRHIGSPLRACIWLGNRIVNATLRVANFALALVILLAILDRLIGTPVATEWLNSISNAPLHQLVESVMESIPAIVDEIGEFARHIANRLHLSNADPLSYANEGYVNMTDLASHIA